LGRRRRSRVGTLGVLIGVVVFIGVGYRLVGGRSRAPVATSTALASLAIPAIYALPPLPSQRLRNPQAVARAMGFLTAMQPSGTYVLSTEGTATVVPMDVAHAAIAFASGDRLRSAESAMTWLYGQMILPGASDAIDENGDDFSGSWYDDLQTNGDPVPGASRGRGESVGMALIATDTIERQDPGYLTTRVGDNQIVDLVRLATEYLSRPTMQAAEGRFYHSPTYRVSFNEECARMALGLQLAAQMLREHGDAVAAQRAAAAAASGMRALDSGASMSQGMAYDYYARSIWGLASPSEAKAEIARLKATGLVDAGGVRNWDWQLSTAASPLVWLRWWGQAQTVAPSQTFDYAIASVSAGDTATALALEQRWLPLQNPAGGFDDGSLFGPFGLRLGFGQPTSYAAARFILLEHLLTEVLGR